MKVYARLNLETGKLTLLTFPDGRPIPFPDKHLNNESGILRSLRRFFWRSAWQLTGNYTTAEIHGRNMLQGDLSASFEVKRSFYKTNSQNALEEVEPEKGIVVATDVPLSSSKEWKIQRWIRQLFVLALKQLEGQFPTYKTPAYFERQHIQVPNLNVGSKVYLPKTREEMLANDPILIIKEKQIGITVVQEIYQNLPKYPDIATPDIVVKPDMRETDATPVLSPELSARAVQLSGTNAPGILRSSGSLDEGERAQLLPSYGQHKVADPALATSSTRDGSTLRARRT